MVERLKRSLYLKLFLSFLATCVLLFVALAVFWNFYFSDLFYKEKKELLQARAAEVDKLLTPLQEGVISIRELRLGLRILGRSFNGQVWIVDQKGTILYSSLEREGMLIPKTMDTLFLEAMRGKSGYSTAVIAQGAKTNEHVLTYYSLINLNDSPAVLFLHTPAEEISEAVQAVRWNIVVPLMFSLLAVGVILFTLSRRLAGPLRQMNATALAMAEGDFSKRVQIISGDEIGQLASSFNFMVDQLEQWEDSRKDFLANVSHELRSPLTTLRGFIVAMNDGVIPAERYPHYLQICDYEVQRLQRLVTDLLDLARIQNGSDVFRAVPLDVTQRTEEVLDWLLPSFQSKQLAIHVRLPHPSEPPIICLLDPDRYAQIVQNLLYNAIQFTPQAGRIDVIMESTVDQFRLTIRDTGIGMSEDEMQRIWDRFFKADRSRGERTDGTGLGLTIVKHLVTGLKGYIDVSSSVGHGTEFRVTFPLYRDEEAA
ncbi:sensor histidine kinase [Paenibacillus koleovorans]|uniref:sensor histidine kinase n=1 Tax=Paenibacillus koleovorans TaxID=121608 RepID=UPI000FDB9ED1|nr:HAMP domain-containing sensor histidine kinase [Paenibacillus koleovorans]